MATKAKQTAGDGSKFDMPFKSVLAANRGEIAVRIMRAGNELGLRTVGIFSKEDRFTQHRYRFEHWLGCDAFCKYVCLPVPAGKRDVAHPGALPHAVVLRMYGTQVQPDFMYLLLCDMKAK